jgi:hypothetical protein
VPAPEGAFSCTTLRGSCSDTELMEVTAQGHRPQILDAKIFRSKVERREEERETEVK